MSRRLSEVVLKASRSTSVFPKAQLFRQAWHGVYAQNKAPLIPSELRKRERWKAFITACQTLSTTWRGKNIYIYLISPSVTIFFKNVTSITTLKVANVPAKCHILFSVFAFLNPDFESKINGRKKLPIACLGKASDSQCVLLAQEQRDTRDGAFIWLIATHKHSAPQSAAPRLTYNVDHWEHLFWVLSVVCFEVHFNGECSVLES